MNFMEALKQEAARTQHTLTENGAVVYQSTGKKLLDLNFAAGSFRSRTNGQIIDSFLAAFSEDPLYAVTWLFYCRDCRGGMGERRIFRVVMSHLASCTAYAPLVKAVLPLIAEYGRWDDVTHLLESSCNEVSTAICDLIAIQLSNDVKSAKANESTSLLAKWLPSDNASSAASRRLAKKIADGMHVDITTYRRIVVNLRAYLKVLERDLSANRWEHVDYSAVPSQANLLYRKAFLKHDYDRRTAYLESVKSGEEKINASTLFPHDIVSRYNAYYGGRRTEDSLESLWKALPDYVNGSAGTLVVRDGSGSMTIPVQRGSSVRALDVATALAVYFAERQSGPYKDQFITFSSRPKFVSLANIATLREKLFRCSRETEASNTNIEAVFDLILTTAVKNHCKQEELPKTVLIISDMEFDCATSSRVNETLFDAICRRYQAAGYQMPKLAFWNVCSRTNGVPMRENENGVTLVSGFSPATVKMVLQEETDPFKAMMNVLDSERYAPVVSALKSA